MNLSFFLAKRFFNSESKTQQKASTPAIKIATIGISLGLTIIILAISIIRGFQNEIQEKIIGFCSDIQLLNAQSMNNIESYPIITDSLIFKDVKKNSEVIHVQRFSQKMGILKTKNDYQAILLEGIDQTYDRRFLQKNIIQGKLPFYKNTSDDNMIVISSNQAKFLHLKINDYVYAYFFEKTVKMRKFKIAGIYKTNLSQYDKLYVITSIRTVNKLNGWSKDQSSGLEIKIRNFNKLEEVTKKIGNLFANKVDKNGDTYSAISVKKLPETISVFNWLSLLNINIWIILVLLISVSIFSMSSSLLILILERTNTIGVLKALGATNRRVRYAFLYYALLIVIRSIVLADIISLLLIFIQKLFGVIRLDPSVYYIKIVPVEFNFTVIFILNVFAIILSSLVLIIPTFLISRIQPAKAIRFE